MDAGDLNSLDDSSPMRTDDYRLFCTKVPPDVAEQELVQLFEEFGNLREVALLTNRGTQRNRAFAFVTFENIESRNAALQTIDEHEIRENQFLKVTEYSPNRRLYVGNIPKSKDADQLKADFKSHLAGVDDVIVYRSAESRQHKNRGFCFIEFATHDAARQAKRRIEREPSCFFGHSVWCPTTPSWARSGCCTCAT